MVNESKIMQSIVVLAIVSIMMISSVHAFEITRQKKEVFQDSSKALSSLYNAGDFKKIISPQVKPPCYHITILEEASSIHGINDHGQVVGSCNNHAYLWTQVSSACWVPTDLGSLAEDYFSCAQDINNRGQIIGVVQADEIHMRCFAIDPLDTDRDGTPDCWFRDDNHDGGNDLMQTFGEADVCTPPGENICAEAINDVGQITGWKYYECWINEHWRSYYDSYSITPLLENGRFIWNNDLMVDLQPTIPAPYTIIRSSDINNFGNITGTAWYDCLAYINPIDATAFLWNEDIGGQLLGTLTTPVLTPHEYESFGYGINDVNQIVGESDQQFMNGKTYTCAFLWSPLQQMQNLGVPTLHSYSLRDIEKNERGPKIPMSGADDISSRGRIIGWSGCNLLPPNILHDMGPTLIVPREYNGIPFSWFYNQSGNDPTCYTNDLGFSLNYLAPQHSMGIIETYEINETNAITAKLQVGPECWQSCILTPCMKGDLNCDGVVNFADINLFIYALSHNEVEFQNQYPDGNYWAADCNQDGVVNFADINPFIELLSGGK